ncbi:MAG: hypothetical protein ACTSRR_11120 [Candidatus Heimdallarchaeaceae archaeon]
MFIFKRVKRRIILKRFFITQNQLLSEFFEETEKALGKKITIIEFNETFNPIIEKLNQIIENHSKSKILKKTMKKRWARILWRKKGKAKEIEKSLVNITAILDKLDFSIINNDLEEIEYLLEDIIEIDYAYEKLNKLKNAINSFDILLEKMLSVFNFYAILISNESIKNFDNLIVRIEKDSLRWKAEIDTYEILKEAIEERAERINRLKVFNDMLVKKESVSITEMMDKLDFENRENLEKWLLENVPVNTILISREIIQFNKNVSKKEIAEAIDSLLKDYEKWVKQGVGKKT